MNNPRMDWQQVVLNGGPPCFFVETKTIDKRPHYCARAETWRGHQGARVHEFVSLHSLLTTVRKEARAAAFKEVIGIAENEMVDADSSQNEEDFAYNRAIFDVVEAIQVAANTEEGGGDG